MNEVPPTPFEKMEARICLYCDHALGDGHGHFVPPSFGEPGFPACHALCDQCKAEIGDNDARI